MLRKVFEQAQAVKNNKKQTMNGTMYGNIFTEEITITELDKYLERTKKNTAPGKSGIRVDHIAVLPLKLREGIAKFLSLPYLTGIEFKDWNEEILNWIPKEEGNTDINKRRPIMYHEVMRKMCIGIRIRKILNVWRTNGIIDEDNYAFLTGQTTMQPLMIKKLLLEYAKYKRKNITVVDIDFSKAWDSTERFAKEMSPRRMGFPEEGIDMWTKYDGTRKIRILTAHGLTEPITPVCGAWGQGAVESPIGWLCFMCWMSAYVDNEAKKPFVHKTKTATTKINKVIYADDGTYFAATRKGAQTTVNAVSDFASATGIMVKPQKSYFYSTEEGEPIAIRTLIKKKTKNTKKELQCTQMNETNITEFSRHLGNTQNAKGEQSIYGTELHDKSIQQGTYEKTRRNINAANSRNPTGRGIKYVLESVIYPQILYPMQYNNTSTKDIESLQRLIYRAI